ncbi:terminase large subunit domain-containing protein [Paeniglutamicibacter sp. R2-26]|uniref:terminase large subunit domain-containing protein n=1 Tax=Paeniglutamicibacter sp. R2-26 TaxID=3144417 RepID=UPI003EE6B289
MTSPAVSTWQYPYVPTERQSEAHKSGAEETLFGGAAGGGKSEFLLGALVTMCLLVPGVQVIAFRRSFPDLKRSLIQKLMPRLPKHIAKYNSQDHAWTFANGARLEMAYLKHENDIYNYQGAEYALIAFDELTQFNEAQYKYLLSRARAGGEVLERMQKLGLKPTVIATANPGGIGHLWVKARFIDPAPVNTLFTVPPTEDEPDPLTRRFLPSLMTDNPHLDQDQYRRQLQAMDPILRKALLEGNWDILEGVRFTAWNKAVHVIKPELLPISHVGHPRAVGVDYGSTSPFAALWGAKLADDLIVVYRELYRKNLTPLQQAELIRDSELPDERRPERPIPIALDSACWAKDPTQLVFGTLAKDIPPPGSIASYYRDVFGAQVVKSKKDRIGGWALIDHHLAVRGDKLPRLLVHDTCVNLIRTLPAMPRAKRNPEDIDTNHPEDHLPDALRYLIQELTGKTAPSKPDPRELYKRPETITGSLVGAGF